MIRIVLRPYPTIEFQGYPGVVGFSLVALMVYAVTLLILQR
ncbi:hypothetical protein SG09_38060 [Bradyrhizobium ottawaense]|nr:hypothetical protein [Bradyrhizobium ottawaense]BBO04456.1 hypothetical protein SG09_38060 [Bradyrhizobium ottawaense]